MHCALTNMVTWSANFLGGKWDGGRPREQRAILRWNARFHDRHHRPAARTQDGRAFLDPHRHLDLSRDELQQHEQRGDEALAVGMQKAEVAGAREAFGQHMPQDEPLD